MVRWCSLACDLFVTGVAPTLLAATFHQLMYYFVLLVLASGRPLLWFLLQW